VQCPFLILTQPEAIKADAKTLPEKLLTVETTPLVLTGESRFCPYVCGEVKTETKIPAAEFGVVHPQ